jgi:YidC/Oxa1 family membrane protein insertase
MAERLQRAERDIQKRMKPDIENIRAVFSGDERFMRLGTYYRQNGYHPLYSLRSSISLVIQIPFFIAAYRFLSNFELLNGVSFGPVTDLAKPDSLFAVKNISVNILPIAMTLINYVSAFMYAKGFSKNDKIQLYGMAAVFLVLLYNSPAGMVLYWTGNNVFSLIKNIIQKAKFPKKIILILAAVSCFLLDIYVLFFHKGWMVKRIGFVFIITLILLLSFLLKKFRQNKKVDAPLALKEAGQNHWIFLLSMVTLFLLGGLAVPSSLIASSVQEFSFIENYTSPFPFIVNAVLQSAGIFLLWPLCIYSIFPQGIKEKLTKLAVVTAVVAVINVYLFPGNYGTLSLMFAFPEKVTPGTGGTLINLLVVFIAT